MRKLPIGTIVRRNNPEYQFFEEKGLVVGYREDCHLIKFLYLNEKQQRVVDREAVNGLWSCSWEESFDPIPEDDLTDEDIRLRAVYLLTEGPQ